MIVLGDRADLQGLLTILAVERAPRHRSTVVKHCQPVEIRGGVALYDVDACLARLDAVPTRRAHRRPSRGVAACSADAI